MSSKNEQDSETTASRKRLLRRELAAVRARRLPLSEGAGVASLVRLRENLFSIPELLAAKNLMVYMNLSDELPTVPFFEDFLYRDVANSFGKRPSRDLFIPWCDGDQIRLFHLDPDSIHFTPEGVLFDELEKGAFGIEEPKRSQRDRADDVLFRERLEVILVPGVAFDLKGHRLGRGAGYYDRFLATVPQRTHKIGLAYDDSILPDIPTEPHDWCVDMIVTPTRVIRTSFERDR